MVGLPAGCGSVPTAAPVEERSPNARNPVVQPAAKAKQTAADESRAKTQAAEVASKEEPVPAGKPLAAKVEPVPAGKPLAAEEPSIKPYREGDWRPEYYVVKKGDTLYSIALDHGQDYRELAAWNNLADPGLIKIDQRLRLFPPDGAGEPAPQAVPLPAETVAAPAVVVNKVEPKARKLPYSEQALAQLKAPVAKSAETPPPPQPPSPAKVPVTAPAKEPVSNGKLVWEWPTQGKLSYEFGQGANQKGVGIEGKAGQAILAASPGKVVYSGSGLRGYGKLVIIKHNASYLSVYAHNSQLLVKEGQSVAKGQKIAEMGDTDADRVSLHFEIRRLGKPIDPLLYLPTRS
jgi:lipoprotein NlpD